jgi:type I restriction enzyme M protein
MEERIHDLNSDIEVTCFGQEFNPSTFAIAKADMMIRGGDPNNMRFGDTLSDDQFKGYTFQYCISNINTSFKYVIYDHYEAQHLIAA